ncbi:MAG: hypothetical protein NZ839_03645, partial [Endomicrobia bacterium]|nr:hypothetical protein [Endomicrobiia bacterium]
MRFLKILFFVLIFNNFLFSGFKTIIVSTSPYKTKTYIDEITSEQPFLVISTNTIINGIITSNRPSLVITTNTIILYGNFGIGTTNPTNKLHISGGILATSSITAQGGFYGDGSNLTNVVDNVCRLSTGAINTDLQSFKLALSTGTLVTLYSTQTITAHKTFTSSITINNSLNVSTITFLDGTKMISVPIFATRIIAASNSEPKWKAIAHYVCDGNDDQVEIQQAINEVNALKGGRVLLCNGTYYLSKEICTNERHNITLEGMDKMFTIITVKNYSSNYSNYGIILSTTLAARWHNWTIRNITFRDIPVPVIGCVESGSNVPYMNFFTFEDNIIDNCQEGIKLGGENIEGRMNNFRIVKIIFKVIFWGITINANDV